MDADLLRIILAVLGVPAIAGVYWWERRRRTGDAEPNDDEPLLRDEIDTDDKLEPRLGPWESHAEKGEGADESEVRSDDVAAGSSSQAAAHEVGDREAEPGQTQDEQPRSEPASRESLASERETEAASGPMLVVLHVISRGGPFDGAAIVHAAGHCGLEPGEMDIFHCTLGEGLRRQTLFSMANMVNPGTFPFGAMAEFQSPGVTLFARFEGSPDDPGRMEELLGTAHALVEELDAELRDERREPLTPEAEHTLRERVMALVHRRFGADP